MGSTVTFPASECHRRWLYQCILLGEPTHTCVNDLPIGSMHAGIDSVAYPQWYVFQMSVAQEAKKAVENVYGTVYTVGSASNVLCE